MNIELVKAFRDKLTTKPVSGPFMKTTDPAFVEAAGYAGMDFVILDMEHGPANIATMQNNIRAAQISGVMPIVRVEKLCSHAILQALDIGAAGVQIPMISTAEEARMAVKFAKYHPQGERGMCRFVRSSKYSSTPRQEYFGTANSDSLVIIQLEGNNVFSELDDILAVEGIDIIFVGPYDLSQSLGIPGQTSHPQVIEVMEGIVSLAIEKGIITGTFTDSADTFNMWRNAGVRYLSYSVDVGIFYEACSSLVKSFGY